MIFTRRRRANAHAAESAPSAEQLLAEVDGLVREHRAAGPDAEVAREVLRMRHRAGALLVAGASDDTGAPSGFDSSLVNGSALPEVTPDRLAADVVRAAIHTRGSLCVRGLVGRDDAARLVDEIESAYSGLADRRAGDPGLPGRYEEFQPDPPYRLASRAWVDSAPGALWGADSPRALFAVLDVLERAGLRSLARDYLGGHAVISVDKCTLRRTPPGSVGSWHQDGAFLGEVRALNVWVALTHCGDVAPGLDIVPRRLDHIVPTGTEGSYFDWDVAPDVAREAAGETGIVRPIFEPGDVMLFDDKCLHSTAVSPEMDQTRYAIETWFFAPAGFPDGYVPLAF